MPLEKNSMENVPNLQYLAKNINPSKNPLETNTCFSSKEADANYQGSVKEDKSSACYGNHYKNSSITTANQNNNLMILGDNDSSFIVNKESMIAPFYHSDFSMGKNMDNYSDYNFDKGSSNKYHSNRINPLLNSLSSTNANKTLHNDNNRKNNSINSNPIVQSNNVRYNTLNTNNNNNNLKSNYESKYKEYIREREKIIFSPDEIIKKGAKEQLSNTNIIKSPINEILRNPNTNNIDFNINDQNKINQQQYFAAYEVINKENFDLNHNVYKRPKISDSPDNIRTEPIDLVNNSFDSGKNILQEKIQKLDNKEISPKRNYPIKNKIISNTQEIHDNNSTTNISNKANKNQDKNFNYMFNKSFSNYNSECIKTNKNGNTIFNYESFFNNLKNKTTYYKPNSLSDKRKFNNSKDKDLDISNNKSEKEKLIEKLNVQLDKGIKLF